MNRRLCFGLAVLLNLTPYILFGQTPASVWDGIYKGDQAVKGAAAYNANCASCHGNKLEGKGPTPPLAGADFTMNWNGMTVGDLFEKIQTSMPADRPGQLSKADNVVILAYILQFNKFPAGTRDLSSETEVLNKIRFEPQPK